MVYIPGGAFLYGSIFESRYGPEFLVANDIVLVLAQHRLNIFGKHFYNLSPNMIYRSPNLILEILECDSFQNLYRFVSHGLDHQLLSYKSLNFKFVTIIN